MPIKKTINAMSRRSFIASLSAFLASCGSKSTPLSPTPVKTSNKRGLDNFNGRVVFNNDHNYEKWRTAMPWQMYTANRKPKLIARPDDTDSIIGVVNYAREQQLKIAIKSGGHNVCEAFLRDNSLLLDLGELQGIEINPTGKTAWVQPSVWSYHLIEALAPYDLAFPIAHCASVSMGGYLLGGGVGVNGDEWGGIACHSILAAEIITASGEKIIATPTQNKDYYWAVRGAGTGFFGIVTRYQLKLYDKPKFIKESAHIFPLGKLDKAVELLQSIATLKPEKTELMILLAHNPMAPKDTPAEQQKMCIARTVAFGDTEEESTAILNLANQHPNITHAIFKNENQTSSIEKMCVDSVNAYIGLGFGRYAVDTVWTDKPQETLASIKRHFTQAPSEKSHYVVLFKINKELQNDASFSKLGSAFVGTYAVWDEKENDNENFNWVAKSAELKLPYATGQYINEADGFRDPNTIKRSFSDKNWQKLREMKKLYDPDNLFVDYQGLS